jgi:hypothetical protein
MYNVDLYQLQVSPENSTDILFVYNHGCDNWVAICSIEDMKQYALGLQM